MHGIATCSDCGAPLGADAPEGFCPACMLQGAIELRAASRLELPDASGKRFGGYELLEEIARGGMGIVYRARQLALDRIVAVKLILAGAYASEASLRRFRAEAAAAAKLQHPNIVAIHEVGEEEGQPFFSMDYVAGRDLEKYARDHPFTALEAAQLVQTLAKAIHYAHEQGIVHRDLKPSNILIDAAVEPHITDFGLAKQLHDSVPDTPHSALSTLHSSLTLSGQVLGSPSFLPPEQASAKRGQVGPHTDIYALGAILYFLLTGRPPFLAETITDTLQQVLDQEPVSPRLFNPSVPRDLQTICLRCLQKEPAKRYPTAAALAEELQCFLDDAPITARPVTRFERVWRWCRRKPATAAALALVLVVATGSPIAALRIQRERRKAEDARHRAEANEQKARTEATKSRHVAQFMKTMLEGVGPSVALGRDTTMLREILNKTAERLSELKNEPAVEAELRHTIGQVYFALGEYNKAEHMLRESLTIRRSLAGANGLEVAESLENLALLLRYQGKREQAVSLLREALALWTELLGDTDSNVARTLFHLGLASSDDPRLDEVEALFGEALIRRRKLFGEDHPDIALLLRGLGFVVQYQGRFSEAESLYRQSLAMGRKLLGENDAVADSLASLSAVMALQNRLPEAESLYRELVAMSKRLNGSDRPDANGLEHLSRVLSRQGKWSEAESLCREALAVRRRFKGDDHPEVADSLDMLGWMLHRQGRCSEAESLFREVVAVRKKGLAKEFPSTRLDVHQHAAVLDDRDEPETANHRALTTRTNLLANEVVLAKERRSLAMMLRSQGKWEEAKKAYLEAAESGDVTAMSRAAWFLATCADSKVRDADTAVNLAEKTVNATQRKTADFLDNLAAAYAAVGRHVEAASVQQEAIALEENPALIAEYQSRLRLFQSNLPYVEYYRMADWLREQGKPAEAEPIYRQELSMRQIMFGEHHPQVAVSLSQLAAVLYEQGKIVEAEPVVRDCLSIREKQIPDDWLIFEARRILGRTLLAQKRYSEAEPLLRSACTGLQQCQAQPRAKRRLTESVQHLVQLYEATNQPGKAVEWKKLLAGFDMTRAVETAPTHVQLDINGVSQ